MRVLLIFFFVLLLQLGECAASRAARACATSRVVTCANSENSKGLPRGGGSSSSPGSALMKPLLSIKAGWLANRSHLTAAAVARAVSIFAMYPVDTIKTRIQLSQTVALNGLFKGVEGSLIGQVPYGVLTFGGYEIYKKKLEAMFPSASKFAIYVAAAVGGDVTGSFWLCPSEVSERPGLLRDASLNDRSSFFLSVLQFLSKIEWLLVRLAENRCSDFGNVATTPPPLGGQAERAGR